MPCKYDGRQARNRNTASGSDKEGKVEEEELDGVAVELVAAYKKLVVGCRQKQIDIDE